MEEVIKKFQEYLTKNHRTLQKHREMARKRGCSWEEDITGQRIDDLFVVRYRLEQLLSKAGHEGLCVLAAFSEKTRQDLDKLVRNEKV